ncbi:hypothetical protein [Marinomonas balearica]|uniref:Uncharacterized protein n=1 Tax=Marinomonas balearica TaxID=491947 RepID=A0A4R6MA21_9GAMM|nr:hypothetical protein [Marinomonas balearica]TDO98293.1 hypothetical protein DFP79_1934 [Marinomonas balearica]
MAAESNVQIPTIKMSDFIIRHSLIITLLMFCSFGLGYKYINEAWKLHVNDAAYYINVETRIIELKARMLMQAQFEDEEEFTNFSLTTKLNVDGIVSSLSDEGISTIKLENIYPIGLDEYKDKALLKSRINRNLSLLEDQRFVVDSARLASELIWWKYGDQKWLISFCVLVIFSLLYFVFFIVQVQRKIGAGVRYLHTVVDKLHNPNVHSLVPFERKDEFSELARYVESTVLNIRYDLNDANDASKIFQHAFHHASSPVLIVSLSTSDIQYANFAFHSLWSDFHEVMSNQLQIEWSLDTSEDGRFENLKDLMDQHEVHLKIERGGYIVRFFSDDDPEISSDSCIVVFEKLDPVNELTVLNASISLMSKGNWAIPIRILDRSSVFYDASSNLENIRAQVQHVFKELQENSLSPPVLITKLQQIPTFIHQNIDHTEVSNELDIKQRCLELHRALEHLVDDVQNLKNGFNAIYANLDLDFDSLSSVKQSTERLSIEKLNDAKLSVLDVKRALLPLLEEKESDSSYRRKLIDLLHDIDLVVDQLSIEEHGSENSFDQPVEILKLVKDCSQSHENKLNVFSEQLDQLYSEMNDLFDDDEIDEAEELSGSYVDPEKRLDSWDDY